jgi:hypothetical protein
MLSVNRRSKKYAKEQEKLVSIQLLPVIEGLRGKSIGLTSGENQFLTRNILSHLVDVEKGAADINCTTELPDR